MIKRLFLLVFGLGLGLFVGAVLVKRLDNAANTVRPANLARSASGAAGSAAGSLRRFWEETRAGAAEREAELREQFHVPPLRSAPRDR